MSETVTHYRACNLCEAICGIKIEVQDGAVVDIRGDEHDPFSRGHICPKAVALQDIHDDPNRLKRPVRRTADGWQEISWDEALSFAVEGIRRVQGEYGRDALALYLGNPNVHNYGSLLYGVPLARTLRTKNRFSATSVDQLPHHLMAHQMFGHQLLIPIPDVDRTHFFLIFGANPLASNGSLMTAPGIRHRLKGIRERGGEIVVVDPRRSETARFADQHHFVSPGTDALLLAALVQTVFEEGLAKPGRAGELTTGLDALHKWVAPFSPERVAPVVGVEAEKIRGLARRFATAESAVCYGRMGVSTQDFGALCQWLITALNLVTGNLDRPGGAMFTHPAVELRRGMVGRGSHGRWKSRVRGLPEFHGELPVVALAEEILTPGDVGEAQVRGLLTAAGNPVLSTPNGGRLEEALAGLEFMVSVDFYINETTRHAHLILPPTATLEHDHYDLIFNLLAVRDVAKYSPPLFDPDPGARHDWQILHELESRLYRRSGKASLKGRMQRWIFGKLGPARLLDLLLRRGPYGAGFLPGREGLSLKALKRQRHGIDLGPLRPALPKALHTKDRRVALVPELFAADQSRLLALLEPSGDSDTLMLIGRRQLQGCNSWMHQYPRLMGGPDRCTLLMHPDDARRFGVEKAERVAVASRVGRVEVPLTVSDEVMPGVVSLPHGFGHHRDGVRLDAAVRHAGASINDLTDEERIDPVSGNAALSGVPVTVEAVAGG